MSFDALLTLLLVIFFVIGPLVQRMRGGQQQGQRGKGPTPTAGNGTEAGTSPTPVDQELARRVEEARRRVLEAMGESAPTASTTTSTTIRPANRSGGAGTTTGSQGLDWQDVYRPEPDRPKLDWQELSTPSSRASKAQGSGLPGSGTGSAPKAPPRQSLDWQQVSMPVESFITPPPAPTVVRKPKRSSVTADVTATRRKQAARNARLSAERLPAVDRAGILQGIIWHEILGEPVSKRGTRRLRSRLRSR